MIYVVRHGKTDYNKDKITMGSIDVSLNEDGIKEAFVISKNLGDINIDLIISSPLLRATETATIINEDRKVPIFKDDRIAERRLGKLEGRPYTPSDENAKLWDINANYTDNEVETMEQFVKRVYSFIEDVIEKYYDKDVLVVTHGGVSALINCYFNGTLKEGPISNKFLENCGVASYKCWKDYDRKMTK